MNGTNKRWLRGMLVALGAAVALSSVGCLSSSSDSEADDEENIGIADQELDPVAPQDPVATDGVDLPGDDVAVGDETKDPQPQPWKLNIVTGNPDPNPGPDPYAPVMSTPSNSHHDS